MDTEKENENNAENVSAPASVPAEDVPAALKKKRFRWLKHLLIAFAALVAAALIVVAFFLGPIVKYCVNTVGASALGVDKCSLGEAKIYPFAGYARFENFFIGKPLAEGVTFSRDMLSVGLYEVDFEMSTLFSKKKILEHFEVRDVFFNYEQLLSGQRNIDVLVKNLAGEPSPDAEKTAEPAPEPAPEGEPEEIFIGARYFVIGNVNVAAYVRGMPIVFPSMSADFSGGIGIDEDLTPVGFGMKVAGNFMNAIEFFRNSVLGDAAGAAIGAVSDAAAFTGDAAKAAAGATADAVSDAAAQTGDAAKATAGAVSDAAGAAAGAVSDAAGAVLNVFTGSSSEEDKNGAGGKNE